MELKKSDGNIVAAGLLKILMSNCCSLDNDKLNEMYEALGNSLFKSTTIKSDKTNDKQLLLFAALTKRLNKYKEVINKLKNVYQNQSWRTEKLADWNIESNLTREHKYVGLINMGATCYVNAIIQQLFMITSFRNSILQIKPMTKGVLYELQHLFGVLYQKQLANYKAKKFYDSMNVEVNVQKDTSEFLMNLFDVLSKSLIGFNLPSFITSNFEIKTVTTIKCTKCGKIKSIPATSLMLGLPVKGKRSILDGLESFIKVEKLQDDNAYSCAICNEKVTAEKQEKLKVLPNILIIQLKRFDLLYGANNMKLNTYCEFPYELNLKNYMDTSESYEDYFCYSIKGVIIHTGILNSGHYYSLIKDSSEQTWVKFDDTIIEEYDFNKLASEAFGNEREESENSRNAYLLVYERKVQLSKDIINAFERGEVDGDVINKIEELKKPVNLQVMISESLQKQICEEQKDLADRRLIFNPGFAKFVITLVKEGNTCKDVDKLYEFGLNYLFTALARSDMKDLLYKLTMVLEQCCLERESIALNIVKDFSVPSILRELILGCPKPDARKCIAAILKASINKVYETHNELSSLQNLIQAFIQQLDNLKPNICGEYFSVLSELVKPKLMTFLSNYQLIGITLELLNLPVETSWRKITLTDLTCSPCNDPLFLIPSLNCFIEPDKKLVEEEFAMQAPYMMEFLTKLINAYNISKNLPVDYVELQTLEKEPALASLIKISTFSPKGEQAFLDLISVYGKYLKHIISLIRNRPTDIELIVLLKAALVISKSLLFHQSSSSLFEFIIKELRSSNSIYFGNVDYIDFVIDLYRIYSELVLTRKDLVEAASDWLEFNPFPGESVKLFTRFFGVPYKKIESFIEYSKEANVERLKLIKVMKSSGKLDKVEDIKEIKVGQNVYACICKTRGRTQNRKWIKGTVKKVAKFAIKIKLENGNKEWIESNTNTVSATINPQTKEREALLNLYYELLN